MMKLAIVSSCLALLAAVAFAAPSRSPTPMEHGFMLPTMMADYGSLIEHGGGCFIRNECKDGVCSRHCLFGECVSLCCCILWL